MLVSINVDKCTNCGDCEKSCCENVFYFDFTSCEISVVASENCNNCRDCIESCPEDAITIEEED